MFGGGFESERCVMEWKRGKEGEGGRLASQLSGTVLVDEASADAVTAVWSGGVKKSLISFRERERPMDVEKSRRTKSSAPVASSSSVSSKNNVSRPERSMPWGLSIAI